MDIYILNLESKEIIRVTNTKEADFNPIWIQNSGKISFTSIHELTPNIFTYNIESGELIQNTDVGDIAWAIQYNRAEKKLSAITLSTNKTSKIILVDPKRRVKKRKTKINKNFSSWIQKRPEEKIGKIDYNKSIKISSSSNYSFKKI